MFYREEFIKKYKDLRIAVVYGGNSKEREISIKTGQAILDSLLNQGLNAVGIDFDFKNFSLLDDNIDIAYIAMHGSCGEDGRLQGYFDLKGIKYTGSNLLSSAICMDKYYAKQILVANNIKTPKFYRIDLSHTIDFGRIYDLFSFPFVIKANSQGSAIGVYIVSNEAELRNSILNIKEIDRFALIEEYIDGREFTVGIVGETLLPVLEILFNNKFYDFDAKYSVGKSSHVSPSLSKDMILNMQNISYASFASLGCKDVARVDLRMDKFGNIFVLEINTIPGMTSLSLLPDAALLLDISFDDLVLRILDSSLK